MFPRQEKKLERKLNGRLRLITYESDDFILKLKKYLASFQGNYVLLSTGLNHAYDFDVSVCMKFLKKSQCNVLYMKDTSNNTLSTLISENKIPRISFKYPVYAYYPREEYKVLGLPVHRYDFVE